MKSRKLLVGFGSLLLLGGVLGALANSGFQTVDLTQNQNQKNVVYGDSAYYLRGSMNNWECRDAYRFFTKTGQAQDSDYDYYLKDVSLTAGDIFKFANSDWSFSYGQNNLKQKRYVWEKNDKDGNIYVGVTGTYDIYVDTNNHLISVTLSPKTLLTLADKNYTRYTNILLDEDTFAFVEKNNYYNQITLNRTTFFIDNGLLMTTSDYEINSGYYSQKNINDGKNMWHYTVENGASHYDEEDAHITNLRKDSNSKNVNDFFTNAHYFNTNAEEIAAYFDYDMNMDHYYGAGTVALRKHFLNFTAPLLVISGDVHFDFVGIGLTDGGPKWVESVATYNMVEFDLYADGGSGTYHFSKAWIEDIDCTTIPVLDKYINVEA